MFSAAYPRDVTTLDKTTYTTAVVSVPGQIRTIPETKNPAPGICLPVIVGFCRYHQVTPTFGFFCRAIILCILYKKGDIIIRKK